MRWYMFCLLLDPIQVHAQEYVKIFDEPTRMWTCEFSGAVDQMCEDHWITTHWLAGDTVIDGTVYQRVASRTSHFQSHILGGPNDCQASSVFAGPTQYVREVDGMAFIRLEAGERLLYDITVQIGDSIPQPSDSSTPWGTPTFVTNWTTVIAIDSVVVNGTFRKRLIVENEDWWNEVECVIEGIGGGRGPFNALQGHIGISHFSELWCVADHNEVVYGDPNCYFVTSLSERLNKPSIQIAREPTTGLFTVADIGSSLFAEVHDARGALILRSMGQQIDLRSAPSGLYFLRLRSSSGSLLASMRLIVQH